MFISPARLLKLIEGIEARVSTGFQVSRETAPVIVEGLRPGSQLNLRQGIRVIAKSPE
ncbi:MAG: hypothetical protein JOY77_10425 [Alphaproteobacteria bacterium]|nr:hypothetical protein [Alphaproteobacteria bacterium]